ncbi:MAG TPA: hypothetical protein VGE93_24915 [Bryobacteraceae bacterium]
MLDEVAKHPNDAAAHWVLGLAYGEGKRDQGSAMRNIREAVRLDPNNAWYHFYLSGLLRDSGDIAGAKAEAETARKLDPNNRTFQSRLANARLFQQQQSRLFSRFVSSTFSIWR